MGPNLIRYAGTPEYDEKVKQLRVQPAQALKILVEHIRSPQPNIDPNIKAAIGTQIVLVGDAYHFHPPRGVGEIPLAGYYVDGVTGKVEFRKVDGTVPSSPETRTTRRSGAKTQRGTTAKKAEPGRPRQAPVPAARRTQSR
jgi:hypothetical protein